MQYDEIFGKKARPDDGPPERKLLLCGKRFSGVTSYTVIAQRVRWWTPEIPLMEVRIGVPYCMN